MTNGDSIRSMADEELARFLCDKLAYCLACDGRNYCVYEEGKANGLIKWLKQEAEDE